MRPYVSLYTPENYYLQAKFEKYLHRGIWKLHHRVVISRDETRIPITRSELSIAWTSDQRRDDLYACKVRTEIQSVIDYFSSNFSFLADEVWRKVAGD